MVVGPVIPNWWRPSSLRCFTSRTAGPVLACAGGIRGVSHEDILLAVFVNHFLNRFGHYVMAPKNPEDFPIGQPSAERGVERGFVKREHVVPQLPVYSGELVY